MWYLTAWWALGTAIYFGVTAAITWTVRFGISFGLILGVFFIWLVVWAVLSLWIVKWGLRREEAWWKQHQAKAVEEGKVERVEGASEVEDMTPRESQMTERT
jgi:uncharacterized protein (DUF58 family)